jgi:hypothetical protein
MRLRDGMEFDCLGDKDRSIIEAKGRLTLEK